LPETRSLEEKSRPRINDLPTAPPNDVDEDH